MRRDGVWNPTLSEIIARVGHGDCIVIADAGLPIPAGPRVVDLAWSCGEPALAPVLALLLDELVVERVTIAEELTDTAVLADYAKLFGQLPVTTCSHEAFKRDLRTTFAIVRTGGIVPYSNVSLHAGVPF